ncbi:hypothetical protein HanIR_Chr08g0365901 [Helianthus annuus]|nr:hypothetical protein HanIR_Chr08g0365901 [Helianthus annuus]
MNNINLTYTNPTPHMDTGAERHVTDNQGMIHHPDLFTVNTKPLVGNRQYLPIASSGTGYLPTHNRTYILPDLLYSLHIIKNLLSVGRFTRDTTVSTEFDPFGFSLKNLKADDSFSATIVRAIFIRSLLQHSHHKLAPLQRRLYPGMTVLTTLANKFLIFCLEILVYHVI